MVPIVEIFGNITPYCQHVREEGEEKEEYDGDIAFSRMHTSENGEKTEICVSSKKITEYVSTRPEIPQGYSQSMCKFAMQALKNDSCQCRIKGSYSALLISFAREHFQQHILFYMITSFEKFHASSKIVPFFELRYTYLLTIATLIYPYILHSVTSYQLSLLLYCCNSSMKRAVYNY